MATAVGVRGGFENVRLSDIEVAMPYIEDVADLGCATAEQWRNKMISLGLVETPVPGGLMQFAQSPTNWRTSQDAGEIMRGMQELRGSDDDDKLTQSRLCALTSHGREAVWTSLSAGSAVEDSD